MRDQGSMLGTKTTVWRGGAVDPLRPTPASGARPAPPCPYLTAWGGPRRTYRTALHTAELVTHEEHLDWLGHPARGLPPRRLTAGRRVSDPVGPRPVSPPLPPDLAVTAPSPCHS